MLKTSVKWTPQGGISSTKVLEAPKNVMDSPSTQHDASPSTRSSLQAQPLLPLTKRDTAAEGKNNSLAFLDGLRGIAAMIVYSHHHISEFYGMGSDLMHAYGYQGRHHFAQLRFINIFFAGGTPAVMIFFVLSGYVLSRNALLMVESGKSSSTTLQYLLNAVLRRPLRLWLPPILVSFAVALAFHSPFRPVGAILDIQSNIFAELRVYFKSLWETINPLTDHGPYVQSFMYDPPVWTLAYELNGSVMVYALLASTGVYLTLRNRMIALAIILLIVFEYTHFSMTPFVLGMIIAQLDVSGMDQRYIDRIPTNLRPLVLNALFILGWYFLSDLGALDKSERPWFGLPAAWMPFIFYNNPNFATNTIGACCVVYASLRLTWLQKLLNRAAWLGRVSFALYLIHVPIIWFFSHRVRRCFEAAPQNPQDKAFLDGMLPIPDIGPMGFTTRYLAMQLITLPLSLLLAEAVTVWIDQPSVMMSKRFAARVMQRLHL